MRCSGACLRETVKLTYKKFLAESLVCLQWDVALQAVILHEKRSDINMYDPLILTAFKGVLTCLKCY